jgi:endonuclease YncB( thermonuclease family)
MYEYNATCIAVHDGDTFTLNVDLGFNVWHISPFRLRGCNARELAQPGGIEARDYLTGLLLGQALVIRSVKPDKYGERWDALVELPDGRDLTTFLVAQQWVAPWNGAGAQPLPPWPHTT